MPRRRELADVADGISGHFVTSPYWSDDWPLGGVSLPIRDSPDREFRFDLLKATVSPRVADLEARAGLLHADLLRHLTARTLPRAWVARASLTVWVEEAVAQTHPLRCQVAITDDLGRAYTSTRRTSVEPAHILAPLWIKGTLMARIRARFRRSN